MKYRDKNGNELRVGDLATFAVDDVTAIIEGVPEDYAGDPCTVTGLGPSVIVARITFEGDPSPFRVNTNTLVFKSRKAEPPPPPAPAPAAKPAPTTPPDEKES